MNIENQTAAPRGLIRFVSGANQGFRPGLYSVAALRLEMPRLALCFV
jgi:hypothetical protein